MYKFESLAEMYATVGQELLEFGKTVSPRGLETKECIAPQLMLTNPRNRLVYKKERTFNLPYAIVEAIMLFSPSNELSHFSRFNKNISQFSDDGRTLYGAYGYRIAKYITDIVSKLKSDRDSRQCVLPILTIEDVLKTTKDVPCTESIKFQIRDDKLNMIVNMRSNDIIWGTPYDIFMFTMMQEIVANELDIDMGYYIHQPSSLHVYKKYPKQDGYELLDIMKDAENVWISNESRIDEWKTLVNWYTFYAPLHFTVSPYACEFESILKYEIKRRAGEATDVEMLPEWSKKFMKGRS